MALTVGELVALLKLDKSHYDQGLKDATKASDKAGKNIAEKFTRIGKAMTKVGKGLTKFVTLPIVGIGVAFAKAAIDAEETASKFATVFEDVSKESKEVAKNLSRDFGLSSNKAKELLADTGDLLTGFGFTGKAALDLAKEVNELAVDVASFTNFSGGAEGASRALTKALLGERESVKSLGMSILDVDVKARVLKLTQEGITFETERQAKAYATLLIAQEQSKKAMGDYARTSQSAANLFKTMLQDINDLAVSFGKLLIPIVKDLILKIKGVVKWFTDLSEGTKKTILVIAGVVAAIGPAILIIGKLFTAIGAIIPVIHGLNAALAANPILAVLAAVALLATGIGLLIRKIRSGRKASNDFTISMEEQEDQIKETTRAMELFGNAYEDLTLKQKIARIETKIETQELKIQEAQAKGNKKAVLVLDLALANFKNTLKELNDQLAEETVSLSDLGKELADAERLGRIFGKTAKEVAEDKISILESAIKDMVEEGVIPGNKALQDAIDLMRELEKALEDTAVTSKEAAEIISTNWVKIMLARIKEAWDKQHEAFVIMETGWVQYYLAIIKAAWDKQKANKEILQMQLEDDLAYQHALTDETYNAEALRIAIEIDKNRKIEEAEKEHAENMKTIKEGLWNFTVRGLNYIAQISSNIFDRRLEDVRLFYQNQIDAAGENAEEIERIEEEMATAEAKIKTKSAKRSKRFSLFEALITGSQAIVSGFASKPFLPVGLAMGALASTLVGLQVAAIASRPIPKFLKGGLAGMIQGGVFKGQPGIDTNMVALTSGEYVVPPAQTNRFINELESIRKGVSPTSNVNINAAPVTILMNGREVGKGLIEFLADESDRGTVRLNPKVLKANN